LVDAPETRYVAVGEADVAYQVVGDGPPDLLYFYGVGSHIELQWDHPKGSDFVIRLASLGRLIHFDRRGTGASDGVPRNAIPNWEDWTEDLRAVLDEVGSERAAIFAVNDAAPIALLFTAMHPERVSALVLGDTSARFLVAEDYPIGVPHDVVEAVVELVGTQWGTPEHVRALIPSLADDEELVRWFARFTRIANTPRSAAAQYRYILESVDVRDVLPLIRVPTLVLHHTSNPIVPLEHGRYLADHIEGAKLVELSGQDVVLSWGDVGDWFGEIAEFLTGERPIVEIERILTTVLFTDIVGSTERAASLGDHRWHSLLDAHDRAVRDQLLRFRGKEINTTGDGFVASFDGPARAIRCAQGIVDATNKLGIDLRVGLHTGECEVRGDDLGGLAVHIAARVGASAAPGEINVSGTVKDLVVGSDIEFSDRGEHELKGVPGTWRLFAVDG
jgi:class 3 adenylate cyclase/alpha-beta hydrolase superfamily lysophospholipase